MSDQAGFSQAKREWVERVLSFKLPGTGPDGEEDKQDALADEPVFSQAELTARVKDVLTQAALLPEPFRKDMITRARAVADLLKGDDMATAGDEVDALESAYARAAGAARVQEAVQTVKGKVAYRKLQLAWREAQGTASRELDRFVAAVLADPEVEADELYDDVVDASAAASTLLPRFGGELSDLLDALDGTTDPDERAKLTRSANQVIDDYVAALNDAAGLRELQSLSDDEYGGIAFLGPLQDALRSMQTAIG